MPITKKTKIKIFVGNLGPESTNENVAKKIQEFYEKHNDVILIIWNWKCQMSNRVLRSILSF